MRELLNRVAWAVTFGAAVITGGLGGYAANQPSAQDIYMDKCAVCHARDGSGRTVKGRKDKVKDVRQTIKKMSEGQMIEVVQKGKGAYMDSWSDKLSKEQIKAVVEYYRSLAGQPEQ
jgi:mono/diheme cytochrome c family protein